MTSATSPRLVLDGVRLPRVECAPPAVSSAGVEAIELAASAGLVLDPWQRYVLDRSLGEKADGSWAAFEVGLIVPRQNGKGSVLEARELAGLFLFGEQLILHSAHEFKTAQEAFRRILSLVENTDHLRKRVKKIRTSHGEEGIELLDGARLRFVARSTGSGRGFSGDTIILDEAFNLPSDAMAALVPTMAAMPNPQLWYTSTAGMASSEVLRGVRERGEAAVDDSLCYLEWSAPADADLDDVGAWEAANPAVGHRMQLDFIRKERRALLEPEFARERLGIWDEPKGARVIKPGVWNPAALEEPDVEKVDPVAIAFDVAPDQEWGAVAVAGRRADGRWQVEVWAAQPGDTWMVAEIVQTVGKRTVCQVACDPKSSGHLIDPLAEAGVEVDKVSVAELGQACAGLMSDLTVSPQQIAHLGQPVLDTAVDAARKRDIGDAGWAWHRRNSEADITPLVAVTLARFAYQRAMAEGWTETVESVPFVEYT